MAFAFRVVSAHFKNIYSTFIKQNPNLHPRIAAGKSFADGANCSFHSKKKKISFQPLTCLWRVDANNVKLVGTSFQKLHCIAANGRDWNFVQGCIQLHGFNWKKWGKIQSNSRSFSQPALALLSTQTTFVAPTIAAASPNPPL